jgi:glycerol kinase
MPAETPVLVAIDQGTTSSRAIAFTAEGRAVASAQQEVPQHYPQAGWVEHDPEDLLASAVACLRRVLGVLPAGVVPVALGLTNQRETTVVWERASGRPIHPAIVWQDRRTAKVCRNLIERGAEPLVTERSGLLVDPYFSATKIAWILDAVPGARARAEAGDLCFGTVDSWLLWRLTGGRVHATDATNACRTALFNIATQDWDDDLLRLFRVPRALLPEVGDCAGDFGHTDAAVCGAALPIRGVAGDQQAAAIGQACFAPGSLKSTYGTGAFLLLNTGETAVRSANRLLTTVCYRLNGRVTYAVEGAIFIAGAAVQWLRDGLGVIAASADTESLAAGLAGNRGVYMVPAFTGLGAPHWDAAARGALFGLTRDTGPADLARAALEAVAYQTRDLFEAMAEDGLRPHALRIDGGMAANRWLCGFLADVLDVPVDVPAVTETTALGAACLAGLAIGLHDGLDDIARHWRRARRHAPTMDGRARQALLAGWDDAVRRTRSRA